MLQSLEFLNVFNTLTFKQIFWKTKNFFKKLEYRFLAESTERESAIFTHKTVLPEANVKTNRMGSSQWTHHKEWSFARNYIIFWKILFQFKNLLQRVDLMYQLPKFPYS